MPISRIPGVGLDTTGTASVNTFLRGDNAWAGTITSGTAVASTSGTSIDFTGIPATAKRITVMFSNVSTNGTSNPLIQLGSGSITTSGYAAFGAYFGASTAATSYSTGFGLYAGDPGNSTKGHAILTLVTGNTWVCSINVAYTSSYLATGAGSVSLSGTLDRLRITTVNGTDTFDAGTINIMWEG